VAWKVNDHLELSLTGQNLIEQHDEFAGQPFFLPTQIPRTAFVAATWRY